MLGFARLSFVWMMIFQSQATVNAFVTSSLALRVAHRQSTALQISKREAEIRQKIMKLKREGRLKKNEESLLDEDDADDVSVSSGRSAYEDKVVQRLGKARSKMLGFTGSGASTEQEESESQGAATNLRQGQLGSLPQTETSENYTGGYIRAKETTTRNPLIDPSLFMGDDDEDEDSLSEDDLVDLVEQKILEKKDRERREKEQRLREQARAKLEELEKERQAEAAAKAAASSSSSKQITSGVGGAWSTNETSAQ